MVFPLGAGILSKVAYQRRTMKDLDAEPASLRGLETNRIRGQDGQMSANGWRDEVVTRLKTVKYPGFSRDIVSFG